VDPPALTGQAVGPRGGALPAKSQMQKAI